MSGDIRRLAIEEETRRADRKALPSPDAANNHKAFLQQRRDERGRELQLEGRAIATRWAQPQGYPDIETYAIAEVQGQYAPIIPEDEVLAE